MSYILVADRLEWRRIFGCTIFRGVNFWLIFPWCNSPWQPKISILREGWRCQVWTWRRRNRAVTGCSRYETWNECECQPQGLKLDKYRIWSESEVAKFKEWDEIKPSHCGYRCSRWTPATRYLLWFLHKICGCYFHIVHLKDISMN